jgi:hypothetical protein
VGKKHSYDNNEAVMTPMVFFENIINFAEVRATRAVKTFAELDNLAEDDDAVYLMQYFSIRNCYSCYLDEISYDVKTYGDGSYKVDSRGEGEKVPYAQLITFYQIWKRDYGQIQVSHAVEDICALCYQLANRHRFFNGVCYSSADVSLFCEDCAEGDGVKCGGKGEELEGEEEEEAVYETYNITDKKPKTQPVTTNQLEAEQNITTDTDDNELIDVETLDRENMLICAAKHDRMAQVQQLAYVQLVHKARQHARLNLQHSMRSYTFVCDYGQKLYFCMRLWSKHGATYFQLRTTWLLILFFSFGCIQFWYC